MIQRAIGGMYNNYSQWQTKRNVKDTPYAKLNEADEFEKLKAEIASWLEGRRTDDAVKQQVKSTVMQAKTAADVNEQPVQLQSTGTVMPEEHTPEMKRQIAEMSQLQRDMTEDEFLQKLTSDGEEMPQLSTRDVVTPSKTNPADVTKFIYALQDNVSEAVESFSQDPQVLKGTVEQLLQTRLEKRLTLRRSFDKPDLSQKPVYAAQFHVASTRYGVHQQHMRGEIPPNKAVNFVA